MPLPVQFATALLSSPKGSLHFDTWIWPTPWGFGA